MSRFGLVSAVRAVTLKTDTDRESFVLPAGGLRIEGRVGTSKIPQNQISFAIYKGSQFEVGERASLLPSVAAGDVALLPEGTYYIISNYGDANSVVRSDIRVQAGKLTDVIITHRAAVITLKLVSDKGGEALANTAWSVITPGGDVIKESIGAFPRVVLSEGEYRAIAKNEGKVYERPFNVVNGVDGEVEVVARYEEIRLRARRVRVSSEPRHDIRQRRPRPVLARLRGRADMDEAGELFVRLEAKSVEHVAVEREPAGQPVGAVAERGRRGDDVHGAGAGRQFLLPRRHLGMRFCEADHADHQRRIHQPPLLDLDLGRRGVADFSARTLLR